jgi:DNA replication and repair protein RecF
VRAIAVRGTSFRCYQRLSLELPGGLVAAVGPNGAGKTALVELIHFGLLGYSPRTSDESQLIRFGSDVTRVEVDAGLRTGTASVAIGYTPGEPKRVQVDGVTERSVERLLPRFPVLVFTPDRMRLVQGPPALRRRYFDRVLARLWPVPAQASAEYSRRLVQRNHLLRRVRAGHAGVDALEPWDAMLAEAGAELIAARARLCTRLSAAVAPRLAELGGVDTPDPVRYQPSVEGDARALQEALLARRTRDIERAVTGAGPHLDDIVLVEADHDLRRFGSQGEQRRALLALILGESDLLGEERDEQPLLLLDDVTSELDPARRTRLLEAVSAFDQSIVTTADQDDLAGAPMSLLKVEAGEVRAA